VGADCPWPCTGWVGTLAIWQAALGKFCPHSWGLGKEKARPRHPWYQNYLDY
jgi:hypothetical protein